MRVNRFVPYVVSLLILLTTEAVCYLGLKILDTKFAISYDLNLAVLSDQQKTSLKKFLDAKEGERVRQHPVLGWVSGSQANSAGMRDNREYDRIPMPGTIRIAAFGDSFTYGSGVTLAETWAKQLASLAPSLEVLNYGVGAYGLDQAYLRYLEDGTSYNPHIVFIGYMSENIARGVNVFRPFYSLAYRDAIFTKPRFKIADGELVLLKNPLATFADYERFLMHDREVLAKLGENDYHYQTNVNRSALDFLATARLLKMFRSALHKHIINPIFKTNGMYNVDSEAYQITLKIFEVFYRRVLENDALPIVLIFPDLHDQHRNRNRKQRRYAPLVDDLRARGYYFIDVLEAFEPYESGYSIAALTRKWGHYSPLGNKIVAAYILENLTGWGFTNLPRLEEEIVNQKRRNPY
jgi:hypothetical protein